ncbi:MAG TPA: hypothetical protein VLD19_03055 [Chitinophagaceae bacterium]|nr:hypothetical protein [Chitinophagaceae bacterium]
MKQRLTEEEIQQLLEQGLPLPGGDLLPSSEADINTYRSLFNALKKEPPGGLPYDFSAKLVRRVQAEQGSAADGRFYLWVLLGLLVIVVGACIFLAMQSRETTNQMTGIIFKYKWGLIFALASFGVVQWLDQRLVTHPKHGT